MSKAATEALLCHSSVSSMHPKSMQKYFVFIFALSACHLNQRGLCSQTGTIRCIQCQALIHCVEDSNEQLIPRSGVFAPLHLSQVLQARWSIPIPIPS